MVSLLLRVMQQAILLLPGPHNDLIPIGYYLRMVLVVRATELLQIYLEGAV